MKTIVFGCILALLMLATLCSSSIAQTPTTEWVNFYGTEVRIDSTLAPTGTVISTYDPDGNLCGAFEIVKEGQYGFLACYFDDPSTPVDEGITPGDEVKFRIDGITVRVYKLPEGVVNGDSFNVQLSLELPREVPEPGTIILLTLGLAGIIGVKTAQRTRKED